MKIIGLIVLAALFFIALVRYIEATSIFYPSRLINSTPKDVNLIFEDIYFNTEDNLRINGWYIKSPNAKSTLIFFHGNAGDIGDRLEKILMFNKLGLNVFIIDYRGYGNSEGRPNEEGLYKDAIAAYDYLVSKEDVDPRKIISYGASLGGAVAIDLATKRDVACLISDSAISTAADMSRNIYPFIPTFLLTVKMDSVSKVKDMTLPKLFIHSVEDEIVPFKLGKKLFNAASEPKKFLEMTGSHNTGYSDSKEDFLGGIEKFLKDLNLL